MQPPLVSGFPGCYSDHMAEEFGPRLRRIREGHGVSMRELARRIGKNHVTILQLETGKRWYGRLPPLDELRAIAKALGTTVDELTGPEDQEAHSAGLAEEPLEVVLHRIGAHPLTEEPAVELDQAVAAGRHRVGILQGAEEGARRRRRRHEPRRYLVRIDGDCLEPRASQGDYAVFDPEQPAEPGALVVVAHGDQALVKYLAEQGAVQWLLPLVGEPLQLLPEMRIVGVVKEIRRSPGRAPGAPRGG